MVQKDRGHQTENTLHAARANSPCERSSGPVNSIQSISKCPTTSSTDRGSSASFRSNTKCSPNIPQEPRPHDLILAGEGEFHFLPLGRVREVYTGDRKSVFWWPFRIASRYREVVLIGPSKPNAPCRRAIMLGAEPDPHPVEQVRIVADGIRNQDRIRSRIPLPDHRRQDINPPHAVFDLPWKQIKFIWTTPFKRSFGGPPLHRPVVEIPLDRLGEAGSITLSIQQQRALT